MPEDSLVSEVLEKMIDSQIANTQALTTLKDSIDQLNSSTSEIKSHFTNGFRADIKKHVTEEFETTHEISANTLAKLNELINEVKHFRSVGFWFKTIGGFIAALAAVAVALAAILSKIGV